MGRAERRRMERNTRIEERKGKILMTQREINQMKRDIAEEATDFKVEALLTCFALTNHRLYGHGSKRTMRTLQYLDDLMGYIISGEKTVEELKRELESEVRVAVKCD